MKKTLHQIIQITAAVLMITLASCSKVDENDRKTKRDAGDILHGKSICENQFLKPIAGYPDWCINEDVREKGCKSSDGMFGGALDSVLCETRGTRLIMNVKWGRVFRQILVADTTNFGEKLNKISLFKESDDFANLMKTCSWESKIMVHDSSITWTCNEYSRKYLIKGGNRIVYHSRSMEIPVR